MSMPGARGRFERQTKDFCETSLSLPFRCHRHAAGSGPSPGYTGWRFESSLRHCSIRAYGRRCREPLSVGHVFFRHFSANRALSRRFRRGTRRHLPDPFRAWINRAEPLPPGVIVLPRSISVSGDGVGPTTSVDDPTSINPWPLRATTPKRSSHLDLPPENGPRGGVQVSLLQPARDATLSTLPCRLRHPARPSHCKHSSRIFFSRRQGLKLSAPPKLALDGDRRRPVVHDT